MDVKKVLTEAYLLEWEIQCRINRVPTNSEKYKVGLALDRIEPLFTIDRIQAYVDDSIRQSQLKEAVHEERLTRLAQIYARTLFLLIKSKNVNADSASSKKYPIRKPAAPNKKIFPIGGYEMVNLYEYAIIKQRQTYASNTYPCYRPKQKGPLTVAPVTTPPVSA